MSRRLWNSVLVLFARSASGNDEAQIDAAFRRLETYCDHSKAPLAEHERVDEYYEDDDDEQKKPRSDCGETLRYQFLNTSDHRISYLLLGFGF
ncbi:hypothetical protein L1987_57164 [Smallanthus sonchifolius]|uniref:Uncharacterized protein n=1 Tax=Smallanthus sonchifolius TaxID=185202 RepID=A0ACB9DBV0_9ASTR|nr:hypothetical protein L1987_57164 [Smallanthus sonchifolius]